MESELEPAAKLSDAAVWFGGVKALDGVSIALTTGSIYGIIGPNGSGKSTLLGVLSGHVRMNRGALSVQGKDVTNAAPWRLAQMGVSRTFQSVRLLGAESVLYNVALGADRVGRGAARRRVSWRRGRSAAYAAAAGLVAACGLESYGDYPCGQLPYGLQRRVEVARALAMQPSILLLDEPTAGMNVAERAQLSELIRTVSHDGLAIVLVEHDVQMITDTCSHVFALQSGLLISEGAPGTVVNDSKVRSAYFGQGISHDA